MRPEEFCRSAREGLRFAWTLPQPCDSGGCVIVVKTIATIEARMGSTRLPAKVMAEIAGKPMLQWVIDRASRASSVDQVVIATTTVSEDDVIERLARRLGVPCFRGSVEDVLGRVLAVAEAFQADDLVPLTADNPLIDPELIDDVVAFFRHGRYDYVTTTHMHHSLAWKAVRTFPVGVSVQVCSRRVLADAAAKTRNAIERGYATFSIYNHPERYQLGTFEAAGKYAAWRHPELRLTVDTPEDLALIRPVFDSLSAGDPRFSTAKAIRMVVNDERLRKVNQSVAQRLVHREITDSTTL